MSSRWQASQPTPSWKKWVEGGWEALGPTHSKKASATTQEQEGPWTHGPGEKCNPKQEKRRRFKLSSLATTSDIEIQEHCPIVSRTTSYTTATAHRWTAKALSPTLSKPFHPRKRRTYTRRSQKWQDMSYQSRSIAISRPTSSMHISCGRQENVHWYRLAASQMQRKECTSRRETQGRQSTQHNEINFQPLNGHGMRKWKGGRKVSPP